MFWQAIIIGEGLGSSSSLGYESAIEEAASGFSSFLTNADWKSVIKGPYASGGLADFTGPAWLDGSRSHPELVLNAQDT
jgi:hypothetical protein